MIEAARMEDIVGISISTRPDCITRDYLDCMKNVSDTYGVKISIEYGLQTVNYKTLEEDQQRTQSCRISGCGFNDSTLWI